MPPKSLGWRGCLNKSEDLQKVKKERIKSKIFTNEIPMRQFSNHPKMIKWVFHVTFKKQIINT
jgi:hypothetical protein